MVDKKQAAKAACMEILHASQDFQNGVLTEMAYVEQMENALALARTSENEEIVEPLTAWVNAIKDFKSPGAASTLTAEACNKCFEENLEA